LVVAVGAFAVGAGVDHDGAVVAVVAHHHRERVAAGVTVW
jgi:hypothetical protein